MNKAEVTLGHQSRSKSQRSCCGKGPDTLPFEISNCKYLSMICGLNDAKGKFPEVDFKKVIHVLRWKPKLKP